MIVEALKTPARSSDLVPTVVIGGLLVALSVLFPAVVVVAAVQVNPIALVALPVALLPGLVFAGYELRVAAAGASEERAVPSFVDWGGLARGGVGVVVLTLWYLLPLVAVVAAGLAALTGFLGDAGTIPRSPAGASASVLATAGLGALYVAVFAYGWPAAMATYAVTGRLRAAMNPARVGGVALSGRYLVGWLAGALVLAVPGVIALGLSSVLIGVPLLFYVLAAVASLFGRASGRQLGAGLAEEIRPDHETIPEPEPEATVQTGRPLDAAQTGADTDVASDDGADDETGEEQPSGADTDTDAETGPDVAPDAEPETGGDSPATAGTSPDAEPGTAGGADATTVTGAAASDSGEGGDPAAGESDVETGADGAASGATAGEHPGLDFGSDGDVDGESSSTEDGIDFGSAPSSESSGTDDSADGAGEVSGPSTPDVDGVSASGVEGSNGEPGDEGADADGPSTLDGYALADEAAVSDRIRDPAAALSSFTVDDEADETDEEEADEPDGADEPDEEEADEPDGTGEVASRDAGDADDADDSGDADLGGTPLRGVDDADEDGDDDGFEWGRVDDST